MREAQHYCFLQLFNGQKWLTLPVHHRPSPTFEPPDITDTSSPCRSNFQRQWQRLLWGSECDKGSTELPLWSVATDGLFQKANTTTEGANFPPEGCVSSYWMKRDSWPPECKEHSLVLKKKINLMVLVGSEQSGHQISVFPLPFPSWNSLIWPCMIPSAVCGCLIFLLKIIHTLTCNWSESINICKGLSQALGS